MRKIAQYDDTLMFGTAVDNSGMKQGLSALDNYVTTFAANMTAQITGAVASALSAIPAQIVEIGSQFESSMSQVAATMGITSAAAEFTQLSAAAKEMGETTKFSASQAADALNYLALAGYDAEKSVAALPTVLNLAAAGGIELAEASDMVTDSMSALGLSMDELESFADKMAKTSQKSNTSVAQLGQSILSVGANAQILAGGTTELMTELGILADSGLKSAEAGTALARVIKNLSTPTSVAAEELENLGVKCYDSEGNFRNMQDIFADLQDAMDGFTAEQVQESMSQIFDTTALSSAKVLLSQCGDRFDELSGYIDDADGAAAQMAETMSDNLTGDITICQSALEGLANTAYEKFQGTMRTAVQAVTEDVGTLTESMKEGELSESVDKLAAAFSNAAASAADLLADDVIPAVISGFSLIVEHGNEIISVIVGIGTALLAMKVVSVIDTMSASFNKAVLSVAAFSGAEEIAAFQTAALNGDLSLAQIAAGLYTGQLTPATAATAAFNTVLAANPVGVVAAAIGVLVSVIGILTVNIKDSIEALEESSVAAYDYAGAMEEVTNKSQETINSANTEIAVLKDKVSRYEELREKYSELNEGEMAEFLSLCDDLKEVLPEGTSLIDEQTGAYISLADSIDKVCERMEKQALLNAKYAEYEEAVSQNYDIDKQLNDADSFADKIVDPENALGKSKNDYLNDYCKQKYGLSYDELTAIKEQNQDIIDEYHQLSVDTYNELGSDNSEIDYSTVGGTIAEEERRKGEEANKRAQENIEAIAEAQKTATEALAAGWEAADHEYAIGAISSEEELLAAKKALWAEYGNENNKEHWKYQEDIISTENSIAEERRRAAEQAENELNKTVTEAEEENAKDVEEILQEKWQNISHLENLGVLTSEEAYQKRKELIGEYCPEYSDEWYDYYKTVYDYEQDFAEKQLEDRKAALNEELSAVKANIDSIISEYKAAYSEIQNNISSYKSRLLSVAGDVFSVEETENPDGTKTRTLKVNDIKSQIDKMKKYHELMIEMRDEGASVSLLQEFSKLDPDDGIQMAEYMLSSGDFEQINELYKERDAIAQQLAEDFYSPELEALNSSTTDKILDEYSGLPDEFREIGSAAALNLVLGLNEGISDLSDHFALNAETFFDTSGSAIDNLSADDIVLNTDVESGDMLERGRNDGELYAEGFEQGMQGISAEVDISSRQASTAAALNENMLSSIAQKLLDQLKNITIRNVLTAQLECDGKSLAQIVNAETETNRRVSDAYG
ncbi:MAG: phage tail tape measure protein [Oscillospiraceae bacterium]|nr:phage tail tape measure protein [Oscillospiraceae bacterium]